MSANSNIDRELGWDEEIQKDSSSLTLLPEGDYDFTVIGMERARHQGSDKLPPCNKAVLTLAITSPTGESAQLTHNLFLHTKTEGLLCEFFKGIGQRKHGESFKMNWGKVVGSRGRCKVIQKTYKDKGEERVVNNVRKIYEPEGTGPPWPANPSPSNAGFTPGAF
ncbi:MAG: DUF669 domain-containing protein [Clostridiales bacterium]|nr:DUF669 domain-containing protein [Clostridiales bacterium]